MFTADLTTCAELVAHLQECRLLRPEDVSKARAYAEAFPQRGPAELAEFLVEQDVLTRFQADTALEGRAEELALSYFVLVDVLGAGAMGTVYKARSVKDDCWYATKIIPRRNALGLNEVAEKVKAFKEVRHPRVSALVQIGAQGERVYLAWPLLEGEKLDEMVRRQGRLTPRQAIQVGLQVASGLQAYHERGLFHGLLKPTDVLIGTDRRVRLLDFGVGFLVACERGKSLLDTMINTRAMSRGLECASPESILDPLDRTPAGDQYSLGCILYYCLAGQYPFPEPNPVKKMMAHQAEEPKPLREINPDISPALAAVIKRMMRKDPEERYPDMEEVVRAIQSLSGPAPSGRLSSPGITKRPSSAELKTNHHPGKTSPNLMPAKPTTGQEQTPSRWENKHLVLIGLAVGLFLGVLTWALFHA